MGSILVSSGIALVLWGNFAYKLRRFRGRPRNDTQQANFATLLCMALAFTILDPPVYAAIDAFTGVPNLARLLGDDCGVAGAFAFEPVAAAVAKRTGRGGGVWGNWWFMGATLLVMTALFFAAHLPISEPTARFPVQYDAIPAVAAYRLVFLGAIGLTLCRLFLLWRRVSVAAAASGRATQRQARLQTVVWALGAAYCGYECGYILLRAIGVATPMLYSTVLAYGLLAGCFALILNDGFVTVVQWMDRYRAYHELDPLWRAFVTAFPDLALDSPHRSSMLVTAFGDLNFQLRRRVTEIRDGIMTLQPFLDRMARDEARKYCHAFTGARLSVPQDVEALTLAAALAAKQQGQRAQNRLAEPLLPDATDFDTDLRHLRAVAAAYRRLSPEDIMAVTSPNADPREDATGGMITAPTPSPRACKTRVTRVLTEVFAPSPMGIVAVTVVAFRFSASITTALKWAGLAILFVSLAPFLYLLSQVWRGRVTDIHVRRREQRGPIILASLASWLIAIGLLITLGAPRELIALITTGIVALVVCGVITRWWKISLHIGGVAGVFTVFTLLFGVRMSILLPLLPLTGWARVELQDHTVAQVIAGAFVGSVVSGALFVAIFAALT